MAGGAKIMFSLLCQQQTRSFKYSRSDLQKHLWKTKRFKLEAESLGGLVHCCKKGEFYGLETDQNFFLGKT